MIEELELKELEGTAHALDARIESLERALIPYYSKRRQLMNEIGETHGGFYREAKFVVTSLHLDRAAERVNIFPEFDRLNALNAPAVNEVRLTRAQLRGLLQRMDKLKKDIERAKAKLAKAEAKGTLL